MSVLRGGLGLVVRSRLSARGPCLGSPLSWSRDLGESLDTSWGESLPEDDRPEMSILIGTGVQNVQGSMGFTLDKEGEPIRGESVCVHGAFVDEDW